MKKIVILIFALVIMTACPGCQKIKKIFVKPPPEGVIQESYPVKVYAYESSIIIKTSPQELINYILKDLSWIEGSLAKLERFGFHVEVPDLRKGIDMTEPGQSILVKTRILGLSLQVRIINFKYKPDKELWLMAITDGSWVLGRFTLKTISAEDTMVSMNLLGRPSRTMGEIMDTFRLSEAVATEVDLMMAIIQSEFDPEVDAKQLTEKGLRGELYESFLQTYEALIHVNTNPDDVVEWIINNYDTCSPEIKFKGDCHSYRIFAELSEGEVKHCPSEIVFGNLKIDANALLTWRRDDRERINQVYIQRMDQMSLFQLGVRPSATGSRVKFMVTTEIPGPKSPLIMDVMMTLTDIPKLAQEVLLEIKRGVEGVG